jgi:RimJ/RimL family protein N-acetyltransferase
MNPEQAPNLLIRGEQVGLGPLRRDLIPVYLQWRSDFGVIQSRGNSEVPTLESIETWYEQAINAGPTEAHFTVYRLETLKPVGTTLLVRIDTISGTAEFGVVIAEKNQGFGTEATRLTLDWAFNVLGLYNVMLVTFSWNTAALRAFEKAGFREIGRRHGAVITQGKRHDHVLMEALADDFKESALPELG